MVCVLDKSPEDHKRPDDKDEKKKSVILVLIPRVFRQAIALWGKGFDKGRVGRKEIRS